MGNKKQYLSAEDFLAAITAEREDYDVPGIGTVRIRALSLHEVDQVRRRSILKKGDDPDSGRLMAGAILIAMEEPKLPEDAVDKLLSGSAGKLTAVAKRIMTLSGLTDAEEIDPLAGDGS